MSNDLQRIEPASLSTHVDIIDGLIKIISKMISNESYLHRIQSKARLRTQRAESKKFDSSLNEEDILGRVQVASFPFILNLLCQTLQFCNKSM